MAKPLKIIGKWISWNRSFLYDQNEQRKIHGKLGFNSADLHERVLKESEPIFVLSTGRCGTALLTKILKNDDSLNVHHEPSPALIYHSKKAYEQKNDNRWLTSTFDAARYELMRDSYLLNKRYVETNNRVTFFANGIVDLFPKAKFIHLDREVYEFVISGLSRNWYSYEKMVDEGRIVSKTDDWNNLSQSEKITWLWKETNQEIRSFSKNHPNKVYYISSNELFKNESKIQDLLVFLGIDGINTATINKSISVKVNKQSSKTKVKLSDSQRFEINKMINS